jgi:hypothetical protein
VAMEVTAAAAVAAAALPEEEAGCTFDSLDLWPLFLLLLLLSTTSVGPSPDDDGADEVSRRSAA